MCDLLICYFILGTYRKDIEAKSDQEKFIWSKAMIDDMIDITCSVLRPNNMIEPSFSTINQRVESETQWNEVTNASSQIGKANMRKQKEKKLEQEIINLRRSFIENDPTEKLLNFLASENERSQRHEAQMLRMMLQINNPVHYNQAHSTQIFRNAYYQKQCI